MKQGIKMFGKCCPAYAYGSGYQQCFLCCLMLQQTIFVSSLKTKEESVTCFKSVTVGHLQNYGANRLHSDHGPERASNFTGC